VTGQAWVIGTADDCDVRVADEYVSSQHARVIRRADGTFWVEDLGSTNGTHIRREGGTKDHVTVPTQIRPGDTLIVGRSSIPWAKQ